MLKKRSLESVLRRLKPLNKIREYAVRAEKQVYLVGGIIRDILLDKEIKDIDIAVSGKGEDFARALGKSFHLKKDIDEYRVIMNDFTVDVIGLGTIEILDDLSRRDYTINAMAYNLLDKRFIDPFNGVKDLENGILKAIGRKNIVDDKIRVLRALRFKASFGFDIESETLDLLKEYAIGLEETASERIHNELILIFNQDNSYLAIVPEIFDIIFPGFMKMKNIKGGKVTKDLLEHSILTLKILDEIIKDFSMFEKYKRKVKNYLLNKKVGLKIASLLHDIKKPDTIEVKGNEVHFYGHDKFASEWIEKRLKELKFSYSERSFISLLVENHMWIHLLAAQKDVTERAKRRMIFRLGEDVIGLSLLTVADQIASDGEEDNNLINICDDIVKYYFDTKVEVEKPLLNGKDLIENFDIKPGPIFGRILSRVQNAYEEGEIRTKEEALQFVKEDILKGLDRNKDENKIA